MAALMTLCRNNGPDLRLISGARSSGATDRRRGSATRDVTATSVRRVDGGKLLEMTLRLTKRFVRSNS
jgi:hypothetical protein